MRRIALLIGREPAHRHSVHRAYADAVWAVGAVPVLFAPPPATTGTDGLGLLVDAATECDGVCLTGGGDVDPGRYGEAPANGLMDVDPARDAAEIAVVRAATERGVPILGICRGIQVLAVALGGALHQDVAGAGFPSHWHEERQYEPVHEVEAEVGSLAARALGGATIVNSIHHQAVRDPGPALRVTAWSTDGVIEAVEAPRVLGVQWHPERLVLGDPAGAGGATGGDVARWAGDARHLAPFQWVAAA